MSNAARSGDERWQAQAACAGEVAPMFYPPMRTERKVARLAREAKAKAICATCMVRQPCLEYALANNERYGVWGGLTDVERRALRDRTS